MSCLILAIINFSKAEKNLQQFNDLPQNVLSISREFEVTRRKRATCSISSTLCTAHCKIKGFKRGICNKQKVCVCRK